MSIPDDYICIRGRQLKLAELLNPQLRDPAYREELRERIRTAVPFPHLEVQGWFNPTLLELIDEEFDIPTEVALKSAANDQQNVRRSFSVENIGAAARLYFSLVNSGFFVKFLTEILDVDHLIADAGLYGGGCHETLKGGRFSIHRDFDRHKITGLNNEMVMITYLNKNWKPEWHGALELWDKNKKDCVKRIEPEFGNTAIMRHLDISYHGHPEPLSPPEGVARRSIACYYYQNLHAKDDRQDQHNSQFLFPKMSARIRQFGKSITPPVVWTAMKKITSRGPYQGK